MSTNDITGDKVISKTGNLSAYEKGYDLIWGKKGEQVVQEFKEELVPEGMIGDEE